MSARRLPAIFAVSLVALSTRAWGLDAGAASPDGKTFVVGGINRAVYVYDTRSWQITKRMWLGARVRDIYFTPDGSQCVILGDDHLARIYAAKDWAKVRELPGIYALAVAAGSPVAATVQHKKGGGFRDRAVQAWALPAWQPGPQVALPKSARPAVLAIAADGKTAYARLEGLSDPKEKEVAPGPEPQDYTEKSLWRMRNDGRVAKLCVIDLAGATLKQTVTCFDTAGRCRLFAVPKGVVTVAYSRYAGILDAASGDYKTVITKQYAYGSGQALSGRVYIGALRSYVVFSPEMTRVGEGRVSALPGFPEYFQRFVPLGQDQVVGITDAFRLILINTADHGVAKEIPCY